MDRNPVRVWIVLLGIVSALMLAGWALIAVPENSAMSPTRTVDEPLTEVASPDRVPSEGPRSDQESVQATARSTLEAYWGDQWPEIEAGMLAQGLDLDAPLDLPPWEEVAGEFRELFELTDEQAAQYREGQVQWPDELTRDWIERQYPGVLEAATVIGPREFAELESLTAEINHQLGMEFDDYIARQRRALDQAWYSGAFVKSPFATYGVPKLKTERAFFAGARSHKGWSVRVQLYESDHPDIVELKRRMHTLRSQRNAQVEQYLAAL